MENWLTKHWEILAGAAVTIGVAWYFAQQRATSQTATDPNAAALAQQLADDNAASQASALSTLFGGGSGNDSNPNNDGVATNNTTQQTNAGTGASSSFPIITLLPVGPVQSTNPTETNPGSGNPSSSTTVTLPPGVSPGITLPYGTPQQLAGGIIPIATSPSVSTPQDYHPASGITVLATAPVVKPTRTVSTTSTSASS